MNTDDQSLKDRLRKWTTPPTDPARRQAALRAALGALAEPSISPSSASDRFRPHPALKYAAAVSLGAGLAWWFLPRHSSVAPNGEADAAMPDISSETLREIAQLFPGQLDAIIASPYGVELRLAPTAAANLSDQAVRVSLAANHDRRTIITFSGRSVTLDFGGSPLCITPLINGDGAVIVLTEDHVFRPTSSASGEDLRVQASTLAQR